MGFPLGASTTEIKVAEAKDALKNGAEELDMVINVGKIKDADWDYVCNDITAISETVHKVGKILKVIFETCLLSKDEIMRACKVSVAANVKLMSEVVNGRCEVKASGGIRDFATAQAMINAGASRLGTSGGVAIVKGETSFSQSY